MNRQIPVCNRICFYEGLKRAWDIHESKITNQGPVVDCQSPFTLTMRSTQTFRGLPSNRRQEIQRENNFLLKKLLELNHNNGTKRLNPKKPKGLPNLSEINKAQREQRLRKIQKENQLFNSRLSCNLKESNYSARAFLNQREKTQEYIHLMSRFPYKDHHKNKSAIKFEMKNSPSKYSSTHPQYRSGKFLTHQNFEPKSTEVISVFKGVKHKITGEWRVQGLVITIRNTQSMLDKHTLEIDGKQSSELIKNMYCGSLKAMLQSVSYDSKNRQFFIKLPESNEF